MNRDEFESHLEAARECNIVAVDTEATGLSVRDGKDHCIGISIAYQCGGDIKSAYFPFRHTDARSNLDKILIHKFQDFINNRPLVFANAKFDIPSLKTLGVTVNGTVWDVQVMAHMVEENLPSKELDWLGKHFCNEGKADDPTFKMWVKAVGWSGVPVHIMSPYAEQDARLTLKLFRKLYKLLESQDLRDLWKHESDFIYSLITMEDNGIGVNLTTCENFSYAGRSAMDRIVGELGFTPSGNALARYFFNELNLPVLERTDKGKPRLTKNTLAEYDVMLERINNRDAQKVVEYRGWQKARSTFYDKLPTLVSPDGRVRPSFKIHGTVTGRLSCEAPNLQQIPRRSDKPWNGKVKSIFVPEPGYRLFEFDYGQLEFRLATLYAKDSSLVSDWQMGRDPYQRIADELSISRHQAKTLVLALSYTAGAAKVAWMLNVGPAEGVRIVNGFHRRYPNLHAYIKRAEKYAVDNSCIKYWTGRKRHFGRWNPGEEQKAFNSLCQGGGFELVKRAINRTHSLNSDEARMVLTVHDSVVWEIRNSAVEDMVPLIKKEMEYREFAVPFIVEAKEWGK